MSINENFCSHIESLISLLLLKRQIQLLKFFYRKNQEKDIYEYI